MYLKGMASCKSLVTFFVLVLIGFSVSAQTDTTRRKPGRLMNPEKTQQMDTVSLDGNRVAVGDSGKVVPADSLGSQSEWQPDPKKAVVWSLALPGAGQIYNRDWWKAPIAWGALGTTLFFTIQNNRDFKTYRRVYRQRTDTTFAGPTELPELSTAAVRAQRDQFRRDRDFFIILTAAAYALATIEAYVDAHLYAFDVSEDLSLKVAPRWVPMAGVRNGQNLLQPGLALSLHIK